MKKYFILLAVVTFLMSCDKAEMPVVMTNDVMQITETTAKCAAKVESDGGAEVTAKGVCWSKEQNPTIDDNKTTEVGGVGEFTSNILDLVPNTKYYVRAYATNEVGTAYGEELSFTTLEEPETPEDPEEPETPEEPEEPETPEEPEEPETPEEPEEPEEPETPEEPEIPEDNINGYEYVDLGLPSGLKWATCNLGADMPYEVGYYLAWGEHKAKETYSAGNSITYGQSLGDISGDIEYDAATFLWEATWRIPTEAEARELKDNCTFEWTTMNNVQGAMVTGPNGNQIFLPSGGFATEGNVDFADSEGAYWTSSPDYTDPVYYSAFLYFYNTNFANVGWMSRYAGMLVRPVSE